MALDSPKLQKVLDDVASGTLQLPDFQRDWKWDDERIRAIIATVTLDYPLGVVMTLETGGSHRSGRGHSRAPSDARTAEPDLLLLDGQQRLTSLFQALHLDRPVQTADARNKELTTLVLRRHREGRRAPPQTGTRRSCRCREDKVAADGLRPQGRPRPEQHREGVRGRASSRCTSSSTSQQVNAWQKAFVKADDANWDLWTQFEEQVLQQRPVVPGADDQAPASTSKDAVCTVFERVNTGGVPLNVFELLTATYAGDREYARRQRGLLPAAGRVAGHQEARWPPRTRCSASGERHRGRAEQQRLPAGRSRWCRTWERKRDEPRRRGLLQAPGPAGPAARPTSAGWRRAWPRPSPGWASFLDRQCIVRPADLPYRTQLVPLAAVRAILGEETDAPEQPTNCITRWYWCGVLGEMYGGSTESRFTRDVEQLVAWMRGRERRAVPDTVTEAVFVADRLDTLTTRNSAAYKGIYALLIKQGAVDWYFTEAAAEPGPAGRVRRGRPADLPQGLVRPGNGRADPRANSIVNKTPLSYRASRSMTGSPASYRHVAGARSRACDPSGSTTCIATHLIDPATLARGRLRAVLRRPVQAAAGTGALGHGQAHRLPRRRGTG